MAQNKIIVHLCGGCGASIGEKALSEINNAGSGFAKMTFSYVDTSAANYNKETALGDLWLVKTKSHSKGTISGSGGDRSRHAGDIVDSIKEYLDFNKIKVRKNDEFHLVVFSGSGGTGNMCGATILKELLALDIPCLCLVVGDSGKIDVGGNMVYARNTIKTLETIENYALKANKAVNVIYFNNSMLDNNSKIAENKVNNLIYNVALGLSTFLSGEHESIDSQDMINIIDPSSFKSIKVKAGVYGLTVAHGEPKAPAGTIPIIARTLTTPNVSGDINFGLFHQKQGIIMDENVLKIYKDVLPMHLIMFANTLTIEMQALEELVGNAEELMNSITPHSLKKSKSDDESDEGFIF